MPIYRISEQQNGKDVCKPVSIAANTFNDAKKTATVGRAIEGTTLIIRNADNVMITSKAAGSVKWIDCRETREGDEYACTCGLRWGVNEENPHHVG